ncbi:thioesterase II family protein [Paenibacillus glufosinatiresistens]|uniref:thioesterase II family protein n=1 Tax=Paenibacillus glufosinatiresistens TaxID=3070657 RepID=UPI00286DB101|nr:alpha/beta fold hydrolase [Paenibacillus sp. YX.27]
MTPVHLFCIPYAGGSAASYYKWKSRLSDRLRLHPLEMAGRGLKSKQPFYESLDHAATELCEEVIRTIGQEEEYILFGHSMGSLLAFELYYKLRSAGYKEPVHLFVSGGKAPHFDRRPIVHDKPLEEFREYVLGYDEASRVVFEDEQLLKYFEPVLRSDFKLVELYRFSAKARRVGCPMTVFTGTRDQSLTREEVLAWKEHGGCGVRIHSVDGGHFFINDHSDSIIQQINEAASPLDIG